MDVEFRPLGEFPTDLPHVKETWVGSFRLSKFAGNIPNNLFREVTETMIDQLLERGAKGLVAYAPGLPDHVMGYVVTERTRLDEPVVHYLFVRDIYRRKSFHLGQKLLTAAGIDYTEQFFYTHRTQYASQFKKGRWCPAISRRKDA